MALVANDIDLDIRAQSNFKDLKKDLRETASGTKILNKELNKLVNQLTAVTQAMGRSAMDMKKLSQENARLNKEKREVFLTNKKLINSETLLSAIYTKNSAIAQKKYLHNINGLKMGLQRFREETHKVMILEKGHIHLLDEQSMAMKRFMIQGNMVATTLDNMATRMLNTGKNMQWTGRQMMVGITLPLVGVAAASLRASKQVGVVDRQLRRVVEGGTAALNVLNQSAIELSNTWGVNVEQIKALQVQFAQAGFNTAAIKDLTRQTQEFSVIGDVAVDSAHSLVQALALTGKQGSALTETLAKLNLIDDETSLSMQNVADALPKIVPLFKQYGGTVEQAAALLAAFTDNSIDAVEGANTLKAVLTKVTPAMASASAGIGTRLKGLRESIANVQAITGIDLNLVDQNGKLRNSLDILIQLGAAANTLSRSVGGFETLTVFSRELFGAQQASRGTALLQELGQALNDTTGNTNGLAKAMQIASAQGADLNKVLAEYERQKNVTLDDPWIKFQQGIQRLRNVAIDFGLNHILPVAQDLLEKIIGLIKRFEGLSKGTKDLIVKFGLAAIALGPFIYALGQFTIMGAVLGKMFFTKPLKALFHLGKSFKGLRPEAEALKEAVDKIYVSYLKGDIDRNELKRGVENALKRAKQLEGERRDGIIRTTDALKDQKAAYHEVVEEATEANTVAAKTQRLADTPVDIRRRKRGSLYMDPLFMQGAANLNYPKHQGPAIPMPMVTPDASVIKLPEFQHTGVKKVGRFIPESIFQRAERSAKRRIGELKGLVKSNKQARRSIDPAIKSLEIDLTESAKISKETLENLKIQKGDWERIVPMLIKHSDITEAQLSDPDFMARAIKTVKLKAEQRRAKLRGPGGHFMSVEQSLEQVIKDFRVTGAQGLGIREPFAGSRALSERVDEFMNAVKAGAAPARQRGTRKDVIPPGLFQSWIMQYKDVVAQRMGEDWVNQKEQELREEHDRAVQAINTELHDAKLSKKAKTALLKSAPARIKALDDKLNQDIRELPARMARLHNTFNSKASQKLSELFKKHRASPATARKAGDNLIRNLQVSGPDRFDPNLMSRLVTELGRGTPMAQLLEQGKIPQPILDRVARNLYSGRSVSTLTTELYKELGLRTREKTVRELRSEGKNNREIRKLIRASKTAIRAQKDDITKVLNELASELAIKAGWDRDAVRRIQFLATNPGTPKATAILPDVAEDPTFSRTVDPGRAEIKGDQYGSMGALGNRMKAYEARLEQINAAIAREAELRKQGIRQARMRLKQLRTAEMVRLAAERELLVAELIKTRMMLDKIADIGSSPMFNTLQLNAGFKPFGVLGAGPKPMGALGPGPVPQIQNWLSSTKALPPGFKGELGPGPKMLELGSGPIIDVKEAMDGLDDTIVRVGRSSSDLIAPDESIFKKKSWFGIVGGAKAATREVGVLKGGLASLNSLTAAFTGIAVAGQGGLVTLLKPALPLVAILTAIAAAIYLIWKNWDEVGPHIVDGLKSVKDAALNVYHAFVDPFKEIFAVSDKFGAKGKSMSETWATLGLIINRALTLVATTLNVLSVVITPVATAAAHLAFIVAGLFNMFGRLPGAIQLVVVAMALLKFTSLGAALTMIVDKIAILLFNLAGIPRAAATAAAGISLLQGALAILSGVLIGISMGVQSLQQAMQAGTNAANEFWGSLTQTHELGPQQSLAHMEDAWLEAKEQYENARREYNEQIGKQGSGIGGRISRTVGALPLFSTKSDDERKKALQLEGQLKLLEAKMNELDAVYKRQTRTIRLLGNQYGLTEAQIIEFAKANNVDLTRDTQKVLEKFAEKWQEVKGDINGGDPLAPPVNTEDLQKAQQDLEAFYSEFQNQLRKVVDGWKDAALSAYDDFAKAQVEAIDTQIEAINALTKAEENAQREREYLRRKEELALKRRELRTRYQADRDRAIYEGRYDDAAMMDMDFERDSTDLDREMENLEEDHQKELTRIARDAEIERLNNMKEEKQKQLDLQKQALQKQLDAITEFIPRNEAAARSMQERILATMNSFVPGYGANATAAHDLWKGTWDSAWGQTQAVIAEQAYWAGRSALEQFTSGLGVDSSSLGSAAPPPKTTIRSGDDNRSAGSMPGQRLPESGNGGGSWHKGGGVGNPAGAPQDVPATLQTGEFVIKRRTVAKYGTDFLSALNEGRIYHAGGLVDAAGAAREGLSHATKKATDAFFGGASMGGMNWGQVQNAYRNALGGGFAGGTLGRSIADIVDNMINGIHPEFKARLEKWNAAMGGKFDISRGYRSMAQQQVLYDRWLRRVPGQAPAARPGTSMHNFGLAVDLAPSSTTASQRASGAMFGLRWPMSYEPWHVEPVEARQWRDMIIRGVMPGGGGLDQGNIKLLGGLFGTQMSGGTGAKGIVRSMMGSHGWGDDQWPALERLVQKESSWNPAAKNPSSTAAGLFQFLKSTWQGYITNRGGPPYWSTDIGVQARGGLSYIKERYGNPTKALSFHDRNNWYHSGGIVVPKFHTGNIQIAKGGLAEVAKGERVSYPGQDSGVNVTIEIGQFFGTDRELEKLGREIERVMKKVQTAKGNTPRTFTK